MHGGMELCNDHCLLLFHIGSAEEIFCKVLTECQTADSTEVTWLVDSQSVESSYLDGRALQGGRRYAAALYEYFKCDYCLTTPVLHLMSCLTVARVTSTSEGCQIELRLIVLAITEKDARTELKCVTWNQAGRQEVVTHLQLEGKTAPSCCFFKNMLCSFQRSTYAKKLICEIVLN